MFLFYNIFTNKFFIECPKIGYLKEGTPIENLDKASDDTKRACGIFPIIIDNGYIPDNHYEDESKRQISLEPDGVYIHRTWILSDIAIPNEISATGIRYLLLQYNISDNEINKTIDNISDPIIRDSVRVEWEYAPYIERSHPWLIPLAQAIGLSESEIDTAFREAYIL